VGDGNRSRRVDDHDCSLSKNCNEDIEKISKDIDRKIRMNGARVKVDDLTERKSSLRCQIMKSEGNVEASDQIQRLKKDKKGTPSDNVPWSKASQRVFKGFILISELKESDATFKVKITLNMENLINQPINPLLHQLLQYLPRTGKM
jgi:paraquat-inducible protein B